MDDPLAIIDELLEGQPFALDREHKARLHATTLTALTRRHHGGCPDYGRWLDVLGFDVAAPHEVAQLPFLPVPLFKSHELRSVDRQQIVKTLTSSGTTGQTVSRVFLDRETSVRQTKALVRIAGSFLGPKRLPLL